MQPECNRPVPSKTCCVTSFRTPYELDVYVAHYLSVSCSILDGKNSTKYVRSFSRYVFTALCIAEPQTESEIRSELGIISSHQQSTQHVEAVSNKLQCGHFASGIRRRCVSSRSSVASGPPRIVLHGSAPYYFHQSVQSRPVIGPVVTR